MLSAVGASGWWFIPGGISLLAVAFIEIVRFNWRRSFKREVEAAANKRVLELSARQSLLADTFAEITSAAADMAGMGKSDRIATSKDLVKQVVNAIAWIVHEDVPGLRAVVYEVDDNDQGLAVVRWSSRGHRLAPNPFVPGTDRAIKALALLNRGGSLFVDDIANAPADEWAGSGVGYNTFISSVIESSTGAYGLLTVDAPLTDDLTEDDENDLRLIAGILAMIFAEYRR
jgi:transcriptional regulator with GAF, ATPase, and Fis domain